MNGILDYLSLGYYTGVVARLFAIIGFVILRRQKRKELKIFELYLIAYISYEIPVVLTSFLQNDPHFTAFVLRFVDYLFTVFEFFVFYVYINKALEGINRFVIRLLSLAYYLTNAFVLLKVLIVSRTIPSEVMQNAFIIQATVLLFLCVLYFLKIFNSKPTLDLINEPSFWIITGLTFCMLCTFPLTLLLNNIFYNNYMLYTQLFSIFYFFYIILFIMIIRASLCKKIITS
jgi:hypothetical protein